MSFDIVTKICIFFSSDLLNVKKSSICMTYTQLMDLSNCCKMPGCLIFRKKIVTLIYLLDFHYILQSTDHSNLLQIRAIVYQYVCLKGQLLV